MPPETTVILVAVVVFGLVNLLFLLWLVRLVRIWLQAFLSGAKVSFLTVLLMNLRRSPIDEILRIKIMATQAGINVPLSKIESAALMGADVERAVLALIRARDVGVEVTWEEVIQQDMGDRLRKELFPE